MNSKCQTINLFHSLTWLIVVSGTGMLNVARLVFFKAALTAQQYELGVSSVLPWLYKIMWCHMRNIDLTIGKIFELLDDFPSETVSSTWASFVFGPHRLSFTGGRRHRHSSHLLCRKATLTLSRFAGLFLILMVCRQKKPLVATWGPCCSFASQQWTRIRPFMKWPIISSEIK